MITETDYIYTAPLHGSAVYCQLTASISGVGANAIWISPIPEQTANGYHGYWQKDISNLNPNFGTPSDLKDLVNECHSRGIWVMLDV